MEEKAVELPAPISVRSEVARFIVTVLLLVVAIYSMWIDDGEVMGGAVIGYVAAYWLPPQRSVTGVQ